jgi:hypothetical protein
MCKQSAHILVHHCELVHVSLEVRVTNQNFWPHHAHQLTTAYKSKKIEVVAIRTPYNVILLICKARHSRNGGTCGTASSGTFLCSPGCTDSVCGSPLAAVSLDRCAVAVAVVYHWHQQHSPVVLQDRTLLHVLAVAVLLQFNEVKVVDHYEQCISTCCGLYYSLVAQSYSIQTLSAAQQVLL